MSRVRFERMPAQAAPGAEADAGYSGKIPARRYPRLRLAVVLIWLLFLAFSIYALVEEPPIMTAGAMAIATAALLPCYLWADGRVPGLPVLPLHTLTLVWTYALPLVAGHPEVRSYDDEDIGYAAATVVLYALVSMVCWIVVAKLPVAASKRFRVLPRDRGFAFFTAAVFGGGLFTLLALGQLIVLDPAYYGIVRSTVLALASIAMFVLSLRLGRGDLNNYRRALFVTAAILYVVVQLATLFLVGSIVTLASALIGFTIGRGRVPWVTIVIVVLVFGFLHNGKTPMRERYWDGGPQAIQVWELPGFFAEWAAAGVTELGRGPEGLGRTPIYERVSLMHLLLLAQRNAPDNVPYLNGETYTLVPRLLVPRIFDPDKPDSHQGTALLNQQFGLQNAEEVQGTTIGWGLLNEGYGNFGLAGVVGVAIFVGLLFGYAGRLTVGAPVMSLASMVGITFCAIAFQAEFTMAVFATVLFQSLVVLTLLIPFLESRRADEAD